jgi:hypothetical protein
MSRFNASITPIRANIVGPPRSTRSKASIAACHSGASCSAFGSLVMSVDDVIRGVVERDQLPAVARWGGAGRWGMASLSKLRHCASALYCHRGHCPEGQCARERVGARARLTELCAALLDIDRPQPNSEIIL